MLTTEVTIINKLGIHARAASKFINVAKQHVAKVEIGYTTDSLVNGKSIMQVMTLAAECNAKLVLQTDGEDEQHAMDELVELIEDYFGEGE